MKAILASILLASLTAIGCGNGDGTAGGTGHSTSKAVPLSGLSDDTFSLSTQSIGVKQADRVTTMVGIKRGTNFAQDVTVSFKDLPAGVTANPATPVIKSSATEAKYELFVREDVIPGDYVVNVVGHPTRGSDANNQFTLSVGKKDSFTLNVPFWTTALKQGESKPVTIRVDRDKTFDQEVSLKIDGLPKGVTAVPVNAVIPSGSKEINFTLKADADAALGDFAVTITGHPTKGAISSHVFKFTIVQK